MNTPSPRARAEHPPGARALYLGAGSPKRVGHTTEALVVTQAEGSTQRYPLARLSRIISSPTVDWQGSALSLCLQHGISITWADAKGQALGSACPTHSHALGTHALLELMLEQVDGHEQYENWHRSRRMAVLTQWGQDRQQAINPLRWETVKREWAYQRQLTSVRHLPPALQGLIHAWVVAQLQERHLPPLLWDAEGQDIHLAHDLTELLWAEWNLCSGALSDTTHTPRECTELFERWHGTHGAAFILHLGALVRVAKRTQYP